MTLGRHLIRHLVLAALQGAIVVVAMMDHRAGIGALIGIGVAAIITAFRDHRQQQRRAAESAAFDERLSVAMAAIRQTAAQAAAQAHNTVDVAGEQH